jgi:hypothetical protein
MPERKYKCTFCGTMHKNQTLATLCHDADLKMHKANPNQADEWRKNALKSLKSV